VKVEGAALPNVGKEANLASDVPELAVSLRGSEGLPIGVLGGFEKSVIRARL
jgi:hypothetical protein